MLLKKLHNKTIYPHEENKVCHVIIYIDYNLINGNITIDFGVETNHTGNYIGIETWFPLIKENKSILSCINYVCTWNNLCDQIFVDKWIYSLANMKHEMLQNNLIDLLTSSIHSERCDGTDESTRCASGVCFAEYGAHRNQTVIGTGCVNDTYMIDMDLYMKMQSIEFQSIQYQELTYVCTSENCNNDSVFKHVWKETSNVFRFYKPIMDWLRLRNRFPTLLNSTIGKEVSSNVHVFISQKYSYTTLFWSACIFVVVLISIGIAVYYLYYRKWRGYIAASTTA